MVRRGKSDSAASRAEQLEAALRVHDPGEREQTHVRVEDPADQVAKPVLADAHRPGCFREPMTICGAGGEATASRNRSRLSGGMARSASAMNRQVPRASSMPRWMAFPFPPRPPRTRRTRRSRAAACSTICRGPIGAAIVNDDQLPVEGQAVHVAAEVAKGLSYRPLFVEGWYHHRQDRGTRDRGKL